MKITLESLEALDAIDRQGSFAAAARQLNRVPSALTYTVRKLEQDLDVLLFDRGGHRAVLTDAGRELLETGRHLLAAAGHLERRVRQVAKGWEAELVIAVNDILPRDALWPLLREFLSAHGETRIRLTTEILSGCWDALADGRADLILGASGEPPAGGGYRSEPLGSMPFVFAMSPHHPLARLPEPLTEADRASHRAVVAADTSRRLPVRTVGLLTGQDTLTVPDLPSKLAAQLGALGVGFLPCWLAAPHLEAGRLVARRLESEAPGETLHLAWRAPHRGRALEWFRQRLVALGEALWQAPAAPVQFNQEPNR